VTVCDEGKAEMEKSGVGAEFTTKVTVVATPIYKNPPALIPNGARVVITWVSMAGGYRSGQEYGPLGQKLCTATVVYVIPVDEA
jgi:hypothetical protein